MSWSEGLLLYSSSTTSWAMFLTFKHRIALLYSIAFSRFINDFLEIGNTLAIEPVDCLWRLGFCFLQYKRPLPYYLIKGEADIHAYHDSKLSISLPGKWFWWLKTRLHMSFINSGLHEKSWPYKRVWTGNVGDSGCAHDFILICMLQSTFNATSGAYKSDSHTVTFN